jgi:hypothetical protein
MNRFILTILLATGLASGVNAAEWALTATLDPSYGYDDNVEMEEDEQGSSIVEFNPTLTTSYELEDMQSALTIGYAIERYASFSELDTENPFVGFDIQHQRERSSYGLEASYREDSTRNEAEDNTGDFTSTSTVARRSISPSFNYQLTELDLLLLNGNYSDSRYSTSDFSDYETKSLTAGWQHQFTERFAGGFNVTVANYQSDGRGLNTDSDNDNYNLSATLSYELSELWQVSGEVGVRKLKAEETNTLGVVTNDTSTGSTYDFEAIRKSELDTVSIAVSRGLLPSSDGDVNERDRINITWIRQLSETLSSRVDGSYQETTSAIDEGSREERENLYISPSLTWQFEPDLGLEFAYNYRQQKESESEVDEDVNSNAVFVTLIYNWDGIRASR